MSLPSPKQAYTFVTPLKNKTSAFLIPDRKTNLFLARFLLGCLAALRVRTLIFDTSCFYGTNLGVLTLGLPEDYLRNTSIVTIANHSPQTSLPELFKKETTALIIDDMNGLRSLLSKENPNSSIQKLFLLTRLLSYEGRVNNLTTFTTVYKSPNVRLDNNPKRSLSASADFQITTRVSSQSVTFSCDDIGGWPTKEFTTNVYFELKT